MSEVAGGKEFVTTPAFREILDAQDGQVIDAAEYGRRMGWGQRPALLVIDGTYGFCGDPADDLLDAIGRQRRSCGARAWAAVDRMTKLIAAARESATPVIYSVMEDPSSQECEPGLWARKNRRSGEPPIAGVDVSLDNVVVEQIAPRGDERVFSKNKPSFSFGTGLLPYLITPGVDSLILRGGATSGWVR